MDKIPNLLLGQASATLIYYYYDISCTAPWEYEILKSLFPLDWLNRVCQFWSQPE